jgi:site-specific DNA recombinase
MNRNNLSSTTGPIAGAAYIRYSSVLQSDSFSLDAQLRQINEQAERDGIKIEYVFSDAAQSAYHKKYRPGINAMRDAARRGEFGILYVHRVDRLARQLEWSLEIIRELQMLDINFKAVEQPFDLGTPEGKLLFHLISSLGEFYSDTVSKETNKGKLERSLQGYHNGAVPWGYVSQLVGTRKTGVPDPEKAQVVQAIFQRYATGAFSDIEIAQWLNAQGYYTNRNHPFGKDTVRDMLCNPYYVGKIRYRGMSVRPKHVSFRSTPPEVSPGQHTPIISEALWEQCRTVRTNRRIKVKTVRETKRVYLLQGLLVCSACGRRLWAQTPKSGPAYYRESSDLRGYDDCPHLGRSVHSELIDTQIAELIESIHLPDNWEQLLHRAMEIRCQDGDSEIERKEIENQLCHMKKNYEYGLYDGEEKQYWQKVSSMKDRLSFLEYFPETAAYRAARNLLSISETWEAVTEDEHKKLMRCMLQEIGVDLEAKRMVWLKAQPDYEPIFAVLAGLRQDENRLFWLEHWGV